MYGKHQYYVLQYYYTDCAAHLSVSGNDDGLNSNVLIKLNIASEEGSCLHVYNISYDQFTADTLQSEDDDW